MKFKPGQSQGTSGVSAKPRFSVGQLIQHIHAGDKGWNSHPHGVLMVIEIVPPSNDPFGCFQEEYYYRLIMPYGSGDEEDEGKGNPAWSKSFIEDYFVEVK